MIDGMPGVGKTAFAVHAGHVLSERFPDGQLFDDADGIPGPTSNRASRLLAGIAER